MSLDDVLTLLAKPVSDEVVVRCYYHEPAPSADVTRVTPAVTPEIRCKPASLADVAPVTPVTPKNDRCQCEKPPDEIDDRKDKVNAEHLAMVNAGTVPSWYTQAGRCDRCGPVWLPEWSAVKVRECPWCIVRVPFERPATPKRTWQDHADAMTERAAIREHDGGQPREQAERDAAGEVGPCYCCGGRRFWVSKHGPIGCARCHPPATHEGIVRWIELPGQPALP